LSNSPRGSLVFGISIVVDRFPLTPALSLREREYRILSLENINVPLFLEGEERRAAVGDGLREMYRNWKSLLHQLAPGKCRGDSNRCGLLRFPIADGLKLLLACYFIQGPQ